MPLEEVSGLIWLVLFFLAVLLIAIAVIVIGGLLVAIVSLPILSVLPTVRRQFITLTEELFSVPIESLTNWRFIITYVLFIEVYGFALIILFTTLVESLTSVAGRIPREAVDLPPLLAITGLLAAGLFLGVQRAGSKIRFRTVGEWVVFLGFIAGLTVVAAFIVPWLLILPL